MSGSKNKVEHPVATLIANRWSPYAFEPRSVENEKLLSCFEAARWAASSYNEQPWSFLVAKREDEAAFAEMLECLVEPNRPWAQHAGVLILTVVCRTFSRNGKPNRVAEHDIGLTAGQFTLQAVELGLAAHQMAGINAHQARSTYDIPETHEAYTAIALGYAADESNAPDAELAQRDQSERARKSLDEIVFSRSFGKAAKFDS